MMFAPPTYGSVLWKEVAPMVSLLFASATALTLVAVFALGIKGFFALFAPLDGHQFQPTHSIPPMVGGIFILMLV